MSSSSTFSNSEIMTTFLAEFPDCSVFQLLIDILRKFSTEGLFIFSKSGIRFSKEDDKKMVFNDVFIDASELTRFNYESDLEEYTVCLNLETLKSHLGSEKKNKLTIYKKKDEITIGIKLNNHTGSGIIRPIMLSDADRYNIESYGNERYPNCCISSSDFGLLCKKITGLKSQKIKVVAHTCGVTFLSLTDTGQRSTFSSFGEPITQDDVSIIEGGTDYIYGFVLKPLIKLSNLSPSSVIKIIIKDQKPLKIVSHVGTLGILRTYIKFIEN